MAYVRTYRFFTTVVVILTAYAPLRAQPDLCAQAVNLPLCTPVVVNNASATATADDAYANTDICAATVDRTLWFTFTAPAAGMYEVLLNTTSCTGTGILEAGVLTGTCGGPFTSIACQSGVSPAAIVFTAATAQQFYVVVDGSPTDSCAFTVEVCQHCNAAFIPSVTTGTFPLPVTFTNTSAGSTMYNWNLGFTGGTTTDSDPVVNYDNPGVFMVVLTASNTFCSDNDTAYITVSGTSLLVIPNVFSPNNDGTNDFWQPAAYGIETLQGYIYNRWGEIVHSWEGVKGGWDGHTMLAGQPVPEGVYYYKIIAAGFDGQAFDEHGTVSLFR